MENPFRNLLLAWHRLRKTQVVRLYGVRLFTGADTPKTVRSLIFKQKYERDEASLINKAVYSGERVLEIGAGIGFIGLLAAQRAAPNQVISYEANSALKPLIEKNYSLNEQVPELRMSAITLDGQPFTFHQSPNVLSSSKVVRKDAYSTAVTVDSVRLADAILEHRPSVIIMDVEGAEIDLLPEVISSGVARILVELHPHIIGQDATEALKRNATLAGYKVIAASGDNILLEHEHSLYVRQELLSSTPYDQT